MPFEITVVEGYVFRKEMAGLYNRGQSRCAKIFYRCYSARPASNLESRKDTDVIGPPDPVSNLRPIVFAKAESENSLEKEYRQAREDTQTWNQTFWTKHNTSFTEERKKFQETLKGQGKTYLTADDMSVFYKRFLDKNWHTHFNYNVAWYKRNIRILLLELRVRFSKRNFK